VVGFRLGHQALEPRHAFIGLGEKTAATEFQGVEPLYVNALHCTHPRNSLNAETARTIQVPDRRLLPALTKAFDNPPIRCSSPALA
jgi:hypothetical protein